MKQGIHTSLMQCLLGACLSFTAPSLILAGGKHAHEEEEEFGAAVILIELTDNDIELQVFADAFDWHRLRVMDPRDRLLFETKARGRLVRQGGLSEIAWASEPTHYLNDEEDYDDEEVVDFLRRWPQGYYEFKGRRLNGFGSLESEAYLSHVLAALPEITLPVEDAEVCPNYPLSIMWEPVEGPYTGGDGPGDAVVPVSDDIEIVEYQVIVSQETPEREQPWIDGSTRRTLMNLPGDITDVEMPAEILERGATYEIEVLAIEAHGNVSIGVQTFSTLATDC